MNVLIKQFIASAVGTIVIVAASGAAQAEVFDPYRRIVPELTAPAISSTRNYVLHSTSFGGSAVRKRVTKKSAVKVNLDRFELRRPNPMSVTNSPRYYYPDDQGWNVEGPFYEEIFGQSFVLFRF